MSRPCSPSNRHQPLPPSSHPRPNSSSPPHGWASGVLVLRLVVARTTDKTRLAALALTCRELRESSGRALARIASTGGGLCGKEELELRTANAVESFTFFTRRWADESQGTELPVDVVHDGRDDIDEGDALNDSDDSMRMPPMPFFPTRTLSVLQLRRLAIAIPPSGLTCTTAIIHDLFTILSMCANTLTHLRIAYTDALLGQNDSSFHALTALPFPSLTHLVLSEVGPHGCTFLKALQAHLTDVEINFDDVWVSSVLAESSNPALAQFVVTGSQTVFTTLPNGDLAGLPTPAPSPAGSATGLAGITALPDPLPLLAHSMNTLRMLRASNAIIVIVADKLRYPGVRSLALRLADVPTVTPLVHAFPSVSDMYVYTPFDGCSMRSPLPPHGSPTFASFEAGGSNSTHGTLNRTSSFPPPMPRLSATRDSNRTSQLYSSFSPLSHVRGFVPGLYALGLVCPISYLEIGSLSPGPTHIVKNRHGVTWQHSEARAVQSVLADTTPTRLSLGLRGWWIGSFRGKLRAKERDELRTLFNGYAGAHAHTGVCELLVRVHEPGRWKDVTDDLLAMLLPLANTLTTFLLHWDRTSVPFDRPPADDDEGVGSPVDPLQLPSGDRHSNAARVEAFARRIAEQTPTLRYILFSILENISGTRCLWRVDRSEGWLCLDALAEAEGQKLMDVEGLYFENRVQY